MMFFCDPHGILDLPGLFKDETVISELSTDSVMCCRNSCQLLLLGLGEGDNVGGVGVF